MYNMIKCIEIMAGYYLKSIFVSKFSQRANAVVVDL